MNQDIYVFGSTVRGEIRTDSDVDILVIPRSSSYVRNCPDSWSVYSENTLREYYEKGRLFAWHLHNEARCIYSNQKIPFLEELGKPKPYITFVNDLIILEQLLFESLAAIENGTYSLIYELGITYTAMRDIAMVASSQLLNQPSFSRDSPYLLPFNFPLSYEIYKGLMQARLISTRGANTNMNFEEIKQAIVSLPIREWAQNIRKAL